MRVAADFTLIHEGTPARCMYLVQAGHFKSVRSGEDGYEHVLDFAGRHDVLGCDGLATGRHASGAVALEESWVFALATVDLQRVGQRWPQFNAHWQAAMVVQLTRAGEKTWLMAPWARRSGPPASSCSTRAAWQIGRALCRERV